MTPAEARRDYNRNYADKPPAYDKTCILMWLLAVAIVTAFWSFVYRAITTFPGGFQ